MESAATLFEHDASIINPAVRTQPLAQIGKTSVPSKYSEDVLGEARNRQRLERERSEKVRYENKIALLLGRPPTALLENSQGTTGIPLDPSSADKVKEPFQSISSLRPIRARLTQEREDDLKEIAEIEAAVASPKMHEEEGLSLIQQLFAREGLDAEVPPWIKSIHHGPL